MTKLYIIDLLFFLKIIFLQCTYKNFKLVPYNTVHLSHKKGRPYGQCSKIQDPDLQGRGNSHKDVRGVFQLEYHRKGDHIPGVSAQRIPCTDYEVDLAVVSMKAHHRQLHGEETVVDWDQLTISET